MNRLSVICVIFVVVSAVGARLTREQIFRLVSAGIPKANTNPNYRYSGFHGQSFPIRPAPRPQPQHFPQNDNTLFHSRRGFHVFGQQHVFGFGNNQGRSYPVRQPTPTQYNLRRYNPFRGNVQRVPVIQRLPKARTPVHAVPNVGTPIQALPNVHIPIQSFPNVHTPIQSLPNVHTPIQSFPAAKPVAQFSCPEMKDYSAEYVLSSNNKEYPEQEINSEMKQHPVLSNSEHFPAVFPDHFISLEYSVGIIAACPSQKKRLWSFRDNGGKCWLIDLIQNVHFMECLPNEMCSRCGTEAAVQKKCMKNYQYVVVWTYCPHLNQGLRIARKQIVIPTHCTCAQMSCTQVRK